MSTIQESSDEVMSSSTAIQINVKGAAPAFDLYKYLGVVYMVTSWTIEYISGSGGLGGCKFVAKGHLRVLDFVCIYCAYHPNEHGSYCFPCLVCSSTQSLDEQSS